MDKSTEKDIMASGIPEEQEGELVNADDICEDEEDATEADEEALAELKKFEDSVDRSFKNIITIGSIVLGAAVIIGVVLSLIL